MKLLAPINEATTINRMEKIRALFAKNPLKFQGGMQYNEQLKYVTWDIDLRKYKTVELIHITDVQFGHVACQVKHVKEFYDWVLSVPNRFVLFGGDMVDAGTKVSVGSPWEQLWEPQGQLYRFVEMTAPIRHRVLGYVGGNHERRSTLTFGDLGQSIATALQIPYSNGVQFVDINYGEHQSFRINLWHGKGAGITPGSKMNMLNAFMQQGDAQLYLVGHLHDPMTRFMSRPIRQAGKNAVKLIKVGGAMSSSFLEWFGTYAEVMMLPSTPLMMARTILEPNGHWELTLR